jgi:hypothetical protein
MSLIDAEMSRLKGLLRVAKRSDEKLRPALTQVVDYFVSKTTNLVMMRCTYCEHEWVRDGRPEHDASCPIGIVQDGLAGRL